MGTSTTIVTDAEIQKAAQLVVEKGRVYFSQGKYISIKVFSKEKEVMELLRRAFKGNYYPQGFGLVWTISDKRDLTYLADTVRIFRKPFDKLDRLIDWVDANKNLLMT